MLQFTYPSSIAFDTAMRGGGGGGGEGEEGEEERGRVGVISTFHKYTVTVAKNHLFALECILEPGAGLSAQVLHSGRCSCRQPTDRGTHIICKTVTTNSTSKQTRIFMSSLLQVDILPHSKRSYKTIDCVL